MSEVEPPAPPPIAIAPEVVGLRARIAGHGVIEQLLASQERTAGSRPLDDDLRCTLDPEAESWYSGALGEIRVGLMLATLDPGFTVLHAVPVGERGSDLDHLVIGPAGVYIINTKRHFGKRVWAAGHGLRVENHQVHHLRNLELEISRTETAIKAASGLAVDAVGVIAVVDAAAVTVTAPPELLHREAHVMDAEHLVEFLRGRRRVFSDEQVARIVEAAVRPETWTPLPVPAADGDQLRLRFEALRARVEAGARASAATAVPARAVPTGASPRPVSKPPRRPAPSAPARSSRSRRKRRQGLVGLFAIAGALAFAWWGLPSLVNTLSPTPPAPQFASPAEEQAALVESAGTAAFVIDQHSAGGTRPEKLTLTPGTSVLQTPQGEIIADLPDGTQATYAPSADLLTYTLTLTGPQFGSSVAVSPETGVVPVS
ncbi:nuclease-related domain-containing protein [Microbacterium sp. NPDC056044]|uniref:nuclease-related domain-containing protein n=1 Tax=Microbacterium sp. NPDC056044 TaxID=3345690 RepID=UPI0035D6FFA0